MGQENFGTSFAKNEFASCKFKMGVILVHAQVKFSHRNFIFCATKRYDLDKLSMLQCFYEPLMNRLFVSYQTKNYLNFIQH